VVPTDEVSDAARPGHSEVRVLVHAGVRWRVFESRSGTYDRRGGPNLFFECEQVVRRVRDFPPDWFALPDDELMAISQRR